MRVLFTQTEVKGNLDWLDVFAVGSIAVRDEGASTDVDVGTTPEPLCKYANAYVLMPHMHIQIITVGKLKGGFSYLQTGLDDYLQRIKPYAKISVIEVPDEPILPSKTDVQIMDREGERILPYLQRAALSVALSERGEQLSSEQFSQALFERLGANPSNGGIPAIEAGPIIFIVGGPLGLSSTVLRQCHWTVSLSRMTFPHPMVRLILLEQLYRAFKIRRGEPYHK